MRYDITIKAEDAVRAEDAALAAEAAAERTGERTGEERDATVALEARRVADRCWAAVVESVGGDPGAADRAIRDAKASMTHRPGIK